MENAAAWYRVSSQEQDRDNQVPEIKRLAKSRSLAIRKTYTVSDSAWKNGGGTEYKRALDAMLADAHAGRFRVLIVWSADRLSRNGIESLLKIVRRLREAGVSLISVQEPWLSGSDATTELLLAIGAWMAEQESARRSERTKAGLARRKAQGLPIGRPRGATDVKPRRRSGYVRAWEPGGSRRAAT
jgi:DNA invertase Pin-like site-specific DNA recombinase